MVNFRIGQRVRFITTDGRTIRGTLTRYNRKSVTLVTDDGHQWRVSPSILQPE
jgi:small nuclear ribonucleoprotein (snRNP)-like protein